MGILEEIREQIKNYGNEGLKPQNMPDELLKRLKLGDEPTKEIVWVYMFIALALSSDMVTATTTVEQAFDLVGLDKEKLFERVERLSKFYALERLNRKGFFTIQSHPETYFGDDGKTAFMDSPFALKYQN